MSKFNVGDKIVPNWAEGKHEPLVVRAVASGSYWLAPATNDDDSGWIESVQYGDDNYGLFDDRVGNKFTMRATETEVKNMVDNLSFLCVPPQSASSHYVYEVEVKIVRKL